MYIYVCVCVCVCVCVTHMKKGRLQILQFKPRDQQALVESLGDVWDLQ
jgi:hypothetical protein